MMQARYCDDFDQLLNAARSEAEAFQPPLRDPEVVKTAASAWKHTTEGRNWFGVGRRIVSTFREVDELLMSSPDAFLLLTVLRRHNSARETFMVANCMAEVMRWRRQRFTEARKHLIEAGHVILVRAATRHEPAVFRFPGR